MKIKEQKRKADTVLVLVLFGVFAVCILAVLLTGSAMTGGLRHSIWQPAYVRRTRPAAWMWKPLTVWMR